MNFQVKLLTIAKSRVIELEETKERLRNHPREFGSLVTSKEINDRIHSANEQQEFNQYIVDEYAKMGIK